MRFGRIKLFSCRLILTLEPKTGFGLTSLTRRCMRLGGAMDNQRRRAGSS
ncbi:unnamed protein product [Prunus brigantina]